MKEDKAKTVEEQEGYFNLSEGEFNRLKNKFGTLKMIKVEADEDAEPDFFWFKKPNMKTLSAAVKFFKDDPIRAAQIFANDCLVHGDKKKLEDPEIFMSISEELNNLIQVRKLVVKNF